MISLKRRVPNTSKTKPGMAYQWKSSPRNQQEQIQMSKVRDVSMVERWAAEAYLVTAIPKELKQAMEAMIPKLWATSHPF